MDALSSAIVQTATANQQAAVAQEAGVLVLKKALDIQQQSALSLIQALPATPSLASAVS